MINWNSKKLKFSRTGGSTNNNSDGARRDRDRDRNANRNNDNDARYSRVSGKQLSRPRQDSSRPYNTTNGGRVIYDNSRTEKQLPNKVAEAKKVFQTFCNDIAANIKDISTIRNIIVDQIDGVCYYMRSFYDKSFDPIADNMNMVLDIMTSEVFSNALTAAMNTNLDLSDKGTVADMKVLISTLLNTSCGKMSEKTILNYAEILERNEIFGGDIQYMCQHFGTSEDFAIDMLVGVPVLPDNMNDKDVDVYFGKFADVILDQADREGPNLDRDNIRKIFGYLFGAAERKSPALKVIGKYLTDKISNYDLTTESKSKVFNEFVHALYTILDMTDIQEIKFVMNYVLKQITKSGLAADKFVLDLKTADEYVEISKTIDLIFNDNDDIADKFHW